MVGKTPNFTVVLLTSAFLANLTLSHSGFQLHLVSGSGFLFAYSVGVQVIGQEIT